MDLYKIYGIIKKTKKHFNENLTFFPDFKLQMKEEDIMDKTNITKFYPFYNTEFRLKIVILSFQLIEGERLILV